MKLRDLTYLHKSDRQSLLALLSVAIVIVALIVVAGGRDVTPPAPAPSAPTDSTTPPPYASDAQHGSRGHGQPARSQAPPQLFAFDPNSADSLQLLRLGLRPQVVHSICRYRAAGGIFQTKEDFARIYGLTAGEYRRLAPYITIAADYRPASTLVEPRRRERPAAADSQPPRPERYPHKIGEGEHVVLNTADTTVLRTVPGIGPYFARRIVQYGERLGGYVSVEQLDEIDDFPAEAKAYFVVEQPQPRRLNVNQLTLNELRRHPYISYYQARAITDYRRLHGAIADLDDLQLLPDFPAEAIERLRPYISY